MSRRWLFLLVVSAVGSLALTTVGCSGIDPVSAPENTVNPAGSTQSGSYRMHFCNGNCSGTQHVSPGGGIVAYRPDVGWVELQ